MSDAPDALVLETFAAAARGDATVEDCFAAIELVLEDPNARWDGLYDRRRKVLRNILNDIDLAEAKIQEIRLHDGIMRVTEANEHE